MKNKTWKIFQIVQFIIFLLMSAWIWIRTVDGSGAVQTVEVKLISFGVWCAFYLFILLIEWGIYLGKKHLKNK